MSEFKLKLMDEILQLKRQIRVLKKQVRQTDCQCSPEETTGWTTFRLCNICSKIQKK